MVSKQDKKFISDKMWSRLTLMRDRVLSQHKTKSKLLESEISTKNIDVNVNHINKIVPNSTFNCKR